MVTPKRNPLGATLDTVGKRLRWARDRKGLSQEELADVMTGKGRKQTVSGWENDEAVPKTEFLQRAADALDVTVAWLLDGDAGTQPEDDADPSRWLPDLLRMALSSERSGQWQAVIVAEINAAGRTQAAMREARASEIRARAIEREAEAASGRAQATPVGDNATGEDARLERMLDLMRREVGPLVEDAVRRSQAS